MAGKNKILVEWLTSRDKGNRNRVNVKHIVEGKVGLRAGSKVTVKLGNR